ncbi:hypothetical protein LDENG_00181140, partial [Lucifuga dentata]
MASSPGHDAEPLPLLQLQEVDSSKAAERPSSPSLLPAMYSPPVGIDGHTICIPSPYVDSSHEYNHSHGPLTFYSPSVVSYTRPPITDSPSSMCPPLPSVVSYTRPPITDSPSSMCPPLSPPAFWPSHAHPSMSSLALRCPQPLVYNETVPHAPWLEPKPHSITPSSSIIGCNKLLGKRSEEGAEAPNSSSSADYASGYHYGVWSCEGCKAFFKRSIQGHNDYICPATNQCTIDKNRRKSCQACRLRKCYEVGMMKCGVRRERCSYRASRHRRGGLQPRDPTGRSLVRMGQVSQAQQHLQLEAPLTALTPLHQANQGHHPTMSPEEFISRIIEAEPPDIYLMEDIKKPFTESSMMMSLTNLADKELVLMISWAKKIPGFVGLCLADQIQLLKCCWLEILMLGLMWRSVDHPGKLIFSPDFKLNREEGQCVEGIMEIFDMLLAATSRFHLCTSSPQTAEELESRNKLLRLLDLVIDALVWAISKLGLSTQQQTLRLGHLTMLLSHIRHASNKGMDHLSSMKRKNVVLVYDLLLEMLEAHTSSSSNTFSPSPDSDSCADPYNQTHHQTAEEQTAAEQTAAEQNGPEQTAMRPHAPAETHILDRHLQALPLQSSPPSQSSAVTHVAAQSN